MGMDASYKKCVCVCVCVCVCGMFVSVIYMYVSFCRACHVCHMSGAVNE
jgi:hypothetical protein